ncbi:MAG: HAMP domain-containing histidine kinase [Roseibium sp.]|uniref:sensor histidine kinase n=1 Tax=Roseibium sp. TaxID=1936156 RepID=UPI001B25BC30|nr:HAMP domain-containing sensor histidine kinase [Roseibium sp.]MBO6893747.1 HAMP domain-containing histidine kinase [Roseibium sp.]MBO6928568.1 HAMP domain-containing histidine kinase [Roseibium sp.]
MTRTLRLGLFLLISFLTLGSALAEAVRLQPGRGVAELKPFLAYHSDPTASLGQVLRLYRADGFQPVLDTSMMDWNYAPEAWAAVEIFNDTLDDGRGADPFVLTVDLPLVSEVDAYVIRESGFTENLISYSLFEPFVPEDHSVTRLRTPVFEIAPQETVTVLVNFKFGPFQSFKMALETPVELEASAFASGVSHTAFYAFAISCLVFFFGFHLAMKNWIGMLYAVQFAVGLGFIGYIDGLWFRFFFPGTPALQSPVGFFLLYALSGIGFVISGRSIKGEEGETRLSIGLSLLSLLSVAGFAISLYSPGTYSALFGYILLALMFVAAFVAAGNWRRTEGAVHLSALLISSLGTLSIVALIVVVVIGSRAEIIPVSTAVKGIFSILLVATMTGLTTHIINLRRKHSKAVEAELEALEAEARRSQELLVAERNYSRARELAGVRQRQLATASHDLKQPIMSLRMNLDSLAADVEPDVRKRLREAFDYIEALSNDYLRDTAPASDDLPDEDEDTGSLLETSDDVQEIFEISLVLDTVWQMFHEEAVSKGLELKAVRSTRRVSVPPLVLMRIVSNLVSNAVKYTETGTVLFGVRNREDEIDLCVFDTGLGMTETEIAAFSEAYRKGEDSEGHGLGLSVCHELAREHDMPFSCRSDKNRGTVFTLTLKALPIREHHPLTEFPG